MPSPSDLVTRLAEHLPELSEHGVTRPLVCGSATRGQLRPDSAIDLLVAFDRPVSLFESARLRLRLAELLG